MSATWTSPTATDPRAPAASSVLGTVGQDDVDALPADLALELVGGAAGDRLAVVDDHDVVGEPVGLLEVLSRQQQRGAGGDELADDLPHLLPAADVETGGGLVEDQHRGLGHQRPGQVEPAPHAAGVGLGRAAAGVGEVEPLQQLARPGPGGPTLHAVEPADHLEVLGPGQVLVDGGVLAREPDPAAHPVGVSQHVDARHLGAAAVGHQQRGQDPHRGRLARPVGAEQAEDGALGTERSRPRRASTSL